MALIPVTILTGFLGSGKTTLLKRVLSESHGMKIAVIENEFGQENIDNEILVQESREQIVEMNNGCICCTVRGDLIIGLSELARRRAAGEIQPGQPVVELRQNAVQHPVGILRPDVAGQMALGGVPCRGRAVHGRDAIQQWVQGLE